MTLWSSFLLVQSLEILKVASAGWIRFGQGLGVLRREDVKETIPRSWTGKNGSQEFGTLRHFRQKGESGT